MESLEAELARARELDETELADAIESIGFECTRCGACCKGYEAEESDCHTTTEPHTATIFPDEVRAVADAASYDWRDVARPMPYGLTTKDDGTQTGETFEWALQTTSCGDCTFYREDEGVGRCAVHTDRPLICQTYPFSVDLGGTTQPMGEPVDQHGAVRAHECEGLGRDISRTDAESLAEALKKRAIRELTEAIGVRDTYRPISGESVVVYDSEGPKRQDGRTIE
ncbi:YkgJ family cysteine cluster protein [Natronocalculus amylovorans]|uniref:YkgJ family cysteine cluster protein n=1 Tax=Natronocalculus amylovorans TaxID=2917812 RepID=A0AAE3K6Z2_9EURY|nr:YkgJ family cysteine cluster protein [Natronocalculus amylovorans]MCL9815456.1 YkgJ family cysteine cluster protein [Natronocalculus amylovorans]